MSEISGDELRGHLETMALSLLERDEAHGYELLRRLEGAGCGALKLKEGTLYPVLYRMEAAGLIQARWEADGAARRGPRRRIYAITRKGKRELDRQRGAWRRFVSVVGTIVEAPSWTP